MTKDYSQPDFYRFNHDSLELVRWILGRVKNAHSLLDLGAGSGVIGLELGLSLALKKMTFVELQKDFIDHLDINIKTFSSPQVITQVLNLPFSEFIPSEKYDLIVCNPPYYLPGHGKVSGNENRSMSRSFSKDSWPILLRKISSSLLLEGRAFIVIKNEKRILDLIKSSLSECGLKEIFFEQNYLVFLELTLLDSEYK